MKKNTFFLTLISLLFMLALTSCSEEARLEKLQQRLDDGELPIDLLDSRGIDLEDLQGLTFQGGVIINVYPSLGYTVIGSTEDLNPSGGAPWGCVNTFTGKDFPDEGGFEYGSDARMDSIVAAGCLQPGDAAQLCLEYTSGGSGWLLPNTGDLNDMFGVLADTEHALTGDFYWNTDENEDGTAYTIDIQSSTPFAAINYSIIPKDSLASVRAVKYHR